MSTYRLLLSGSRVLRSLLGGGRSNGVRGGVGGSLDGRGSRGSGGDRGSGLLRSKTNEFVKECMVQVKLLLTSTLGASETAVA